MNKKGLSLFAMLGILLLVAVVACIVFKDTVPVNLEELAQRPDSTIQAGILTAGIPNVKVLPIPQEVYDSIPDNPSHQEIFLGDIKKVHWVSLRGCPYAAAFREAVERTLKKYPSAYQNTMEWTSGTRWINCAPGYKTCPEMWLVNNCMELCIINPQKRQIVALQQRNGKQAAALLEKLKDW